MATHSGLAWKIPHTWTEEPTGLQPMGSQELDTTQQLNQVGTHNRFCWVTTSYQFSSVIQLCLTLCDPMECSMPDFPVHHQLLEIDQTHVYQVTVPFNHLILCCPLLLLPSIFPRIRVFSNESVLRIRWPKYWSFIFSISLSNEYLGLISFKTDWFDLLAV